MPGASRERHLEVIVRFEHVDFPLRIAEQWRVARKARRDRLGVRRRVAPHREPPHESAVHTDVQVLGGSEAPDVVGVGTLETEPDGVVAVDRKPMPDRDAASRPERQILAEAVVLIQQERNAIGLDRRGRRRDPDREPADLARRRQVTVEQGRGHRQYVRHVVEAVRVRIIGRQQSRDIDVNRE